MNNNNADTDMLAYRAVLEAACRQDGEPRDLLTRVDSELLI